MSDATLQTPSSITRVLAYLSDPLWRNAERIADDFESDALHSGDAMPVFRLARQLARLPACTASGR